MQALGIAAEAVLEVGAGPCDEPVEGHGDVSDDVGHDDVDHAGRPNSSVPNADAAAQSPAHWTAVAGVYVVTIATARCCVP